MRVLPVGIADPQLYLRHGHDLLEGEAGSVPEVESQVVGRTGNQVLMLQKLQVEYLSLMRVYLVQQRCGVGIVDLEPGAFPLDEEEVLDLLKVVQVLNAGLMLLPVDHLITEVVILDDVLKAPIVPQQPQFDDMVAELLPLHALVTIHIHLLEEVYQREGQSQLQAVVSPIVVEVLQHDGNELIDRQALLVLLEALLDHRHLLLVQHLKDLRLGDLLLIAGGFAPVHDK